MKNFELDTLSLDELKTLRKDVEKAISTFETRQRQEALAALDAKAREMGFSLSELTGAAKSTKAVHPPKYRNPEDQNQTWSGRGRQPKWIKDALADGQDLDQFLIA